MSQIPPARLSDRPLHSRSISSASSLNGPSSFNAHTTPYPSHQTTKKSDEAFLSQPTLPRQTSPHQYVKWGIAWYPPTLMIVYTLGGTSLAIGHHLYFASLHGTLVGSSARQQWATGFETAISFIVVTLLRAASCAAYGQYVWTLVRRKSFRISSLDKLFALTTDPAGFFGFEMLKHAKIAMLVAVVCWITPLAGITPPATLSVVPGLIVETSPTLMASLDWNSPAFFDVQPFYSLPSSKVVGIATQSALGLDVIPLTPPAPNSSFSLQFYGPSVRCSPPNSTQQKILDYYVSSLTRATQRQDPMIIQRTLKLGLANNSQPNSSNPRIADLSMLVLSAFAPYAGIQGWLYGITDADSVDQFNNWNVDLPWDMEELGYTVDSYLYDDVVQQLYVQTSTGGFVCLMGNASYDVNFDFVDGIQSLVRHTTSDFEPIVVMRSGGGGSGSAMQNGILPGPYNGTSHTAFELSYMAVWEAFTSMISGNISMGYFGLMDQSLKGTGFNLTLRDISSRVLLSGLSACDEIAHNYWDGFPVALEKPEESPAVFFNSIEKAKSNISNQFFDKPAWMCRNRTLANAIEDLAANITISMLSSSNLTSPNSTLVNVTHQTTQNIYRYDSRNLIISYTTAVALAFFSIALGVFSFLDNGVAHSTAFSAFVTTTRNSDLDELSRGHSLGRIPLDESVGGVRLRFGELVATGEKSIGEDSEARHIGFGIENGVLSLQKGKRYA